MGDLMATAEVTTSETDETTVNETAPPGEPIVLPDDHPLVKALAAQKEELKSLRPIKQQAASDAEKARKYDELEQANKTETERLQEQLQEAQRVAAEATLAALRASVSSSTGVPVELLNGSTEEEIQASAKALQEFKGVPPKAPPAAVAQGQQGKPIDGGEEQLTEEDVKRLYAEKKYSEIDKAREEGRLKTVLGG